MWTDRYISCNIACVVMTKLNVGSDDDSFNIKSIGKEIVVVYNSIHLHMFHVYIVEVVMVDILYL